MILFDYIFTGILLILSATVKAVMDHIRFGHFVYKGNWWNPDESWKLKWKNGDHLQGERFFGSSTFLVFLTDGWHFFQHLFLMFLFGSMVPLLGWIIPLIMYAGFTIIFQIIYWLMKR